ncbi:MAG TPA: DM13 domain-containing protein [Kamptonema sp.]|nr:DM13 domain-containing protein [Kamptonema sp.]
MKYKNLLAVGIASVLTFAGLGILNQSGTQAQMRPQTAIESGTFMSAEKPTQGKVSIISENGKRYVLLDRAFKTSSEGPDLEVILYRSTMPPQSGLKPENYVSLGKLRQFSGAQRYQIPDNVKLADYKSVAIWCHKFNATFGYATLAGNTMMGPK